MKILLSLIIKEHMDMFISIKAFLTYIFLFLLSVFIFITSLAKTINSTYFTYMVTGYIFISYINFSLPIGYNMSIEAYHGYLKYISSLPISYKEYTLSKIIGGTSSGTLGLTLFLGLLISLNELPINALSLTNIIILYFLALLFGIFITSFSIILLSFNLNNSARFRLLYYIIQLSFLLLSPVFYTITSLPLLAQWIAWINPLTWVILIWRNSFTYNGLKTSLNSSLILWLYMFLIVICTIAIIVCIERIKSIFTIIN